MCCVCVCMCSSYPVSLPVSAATYISHSYYVFIRLKTLKLTVVDVRRNMEYQRKLLSSPNFKSFVSSIPDMDDLRRTCHVRAALKFQSKVERWTIPEERKGWDTQLLRNFKIDLRNIDRLYHLAGLNTSNFFMCHLLVRVCCTKNNSKNNQQTGDNNIFYYVELAIGINRNAGVEGGFLFICKDASLFMRLVLSFDHNMEEIYQSLRVDDGILPVDELRHLFFDYYDVHFYRNDCEAFFHHIISMGCSSSVDSYYFMKQQLLPLVVLCLRSVSSHVDILRGQLSSSDTYPTTFLRCVNQYITDTRAKIEYDVFRCSGVFYRRFTKWRYLRNISQETFPDIWCESCGDVTAEENNDVESAFGDACMMSRTYLLPKEDDVDVVDGDCKEVEKKVVEEKEMSEDDATDDVEKQQQ